MNTVLIITSRAEQTVSWKEREAYVREFCRKVEKELDNVRVLYTTYRDLEYTVRAKNTTIYDTSNNINLTEADLVHFKNWEYNTYEAPAVAAYLHLHNIAFYNSEVLLPWAPGKLAQMVCLAGDGIPVPETFFAANERLRTRFKNNDLPEGFDYPLIMKANEASRGDDNHLIRNAREALSVLAASRQKEFVIQTFVPNDGDYRFLFFGDINEPLVFHRKSGDDSHLNNTSKGGTGTMIDVQSLPANYLGHARRAAKRLHREIGGVDLLAHKDTGDAYVLEVNATPALATGYGVENKVHRFADFIRSHIGEAGQKS